MVNYLDCIRASSEHLSFPSINDASSSQQQKPEKLLNVNFSERNSAIRPERLWDVSEKSSHRVKHQMGFGNGSVQLSQYRCCCNLIHTVTGIRLFLLTYVILSVITFTFATKSAMIWMMVPLIVGSLSIYALCTEKHKYLYPFLIVSSVHIVLYILIALIIITFTAANYNTFRQIVGYYIKIPLSDTSIVIFVITSVILSLILSILHLWQVIVIYNCMVYFEKKRYVKCEQFQPMILKHNCSNGLENEHFCCNDSVIDAMIEVPKCNNKLL